MVIVNVIVIVEYIVPVIVEANIYLNDHLIFDCYRV